MSSLLFPQLEPLGNKTSVQDFAADTNLKCPTKVAPSYIVGHC